MSPIKALMFKRDMAKCYSDTQFNDSIRLLCSDYQLVIRATLVPEYVWPAIWPVIELTFEEATPQQLAVIAEDISGRYAPGMIFMENISVRDAEINLRIDQFEVVCSHNDIRYELRHTYFQSISYNLSTCQFNKNVDEFIAQIKSYRDNPAGGYVDFRLSGEVMDQLLTLAQTKIMSQRGRAMRIIEFCNRFNDPRHSFAKGKQSSLTALVEFLKGMNADKKGGVG